MSIADIYKFPLFKDVEHHLIDDLIESHSVVSFPAGMQLIRKDVFNKRVYILLEGKVTIKDKNDKLIKILDAENIFGEISVLDAKPASATVTTHTDCKALTLSEDELWGLSNKSHAFTSNLLHIVVERLRSFSNQLDQSKESTKDMQKKAYLDAATGLLNRTWLKEKSDQIIDFHLQNSINLSLIMTDIDHFKRVNDTYGHDVGDLVLKQVAMILKSHTKKGSYAIRLGGDEMCVILPKTSPEEAILISESIRLSIEETVFKSTDSRVFTITSSFGVSTLTEDITMKELMKQADLSLYKAKENGRNNVVLQDNITTTAI